MRTHLNKSVARLHFVFLDCAIKKINNLIYCAMECIHPVF